MNHLLHRFTRWAYRPRCKYCGERFISFKRGISYDLQKNHNMPVRWAWGTDNPTVCQNCAGEIDKHRWFEMCYQAINSGDFSAVAKDHHSSYSAKLGSFV